MKVKEIIRLIEKDGGYQARQKGSHRQFKHPDKKGWSRLMESRAMT